MSFFFQPPLLFEKRIEVETSTYPVDFQGRAATGADLGQSGRVVAGKHEGTFFRPVTVEAVERKSFSDFFIDYTDKFLKLTDTEPNAIQYVAACRRKIVV